MVYFKLFQSKTTSDGEDRYNFKDSADRNIIYPLTYLNNINSMSDEEKAMRSLPNIHLGDGVKFSIEINKKKLVYFDGTLANDYNILNKYNYIVLNADGKFIYCFINDIQINGSVVVFDVETDIFTTELPKYVINGLKNVKIERRHQGRFYENIAEQKYYFDFRKGTKLKRDEDYAKDFSNSQYVSNIRRIDWNEVYTDLIGWTIFTVRKDDRFRYYAYPILKDNTRSVYYVRNGQADVLLDDPRATFEKGGNDTYATMDIQAVKYLPAKDYYFTLFQGNYNLVDSNVTMGTEEIDGKHYLRLYNLVENRATKINLLEVGEKIGFDAGEITDELEPKLYNKNVKKYTYISGTQRFDFDLFDTTMGSIYAKSNLSITPNTIKERLTFIGEKNDYEVDCLLKNSQFSGNIVKSEQCSLLQTTDAYMAYLRNNSNSMITGVAIPAIAAGAGMFLGVATGGLGLALAGGTVIGQLSNMANYASNMKNLQAQPDQLKNAGNDANFAIKTDTVKDHIETWILDDNLKNAYKEHLTLYGYADGERYTITSLSDFLIRSRYNYLKFDDDNLVDKLNMTKNKAYKQATADLLNKGIRLWEITNDIATTFKNEDAVNNKEKYLQ